MASSLASIDYAACLHRRKTDKRVVLWSHFPLVRNNSRLVFPCFLSVILREGTVYQYMIPCSNSSPGCMGMV